MTTAGQVLSYLRVLVWPVIVLFALVLFRDPIRNLLGNIEEFEGFGIKAKVRREVSQAALVAKEALEQSPIARVGHPSVSSFVAISFGMQRALRFSTLLIPPISLVSNQQPGRPPRAQEMRQAVERLNTALIAVIIATAIPESDQADGPTLIGRDADSIDSYLVRLTGFMGWKGIVEAREILSGALVFVCGKKGEAVTTEDAFQFVLAAERAFGQLTSLVNAVADWARRQ